MTKKKKNTKSLDKKDIKAIDKELDKAIHKEFKMIMKHLDTDSLSNYVRYLRSPWKIWWSNLLAGLARGLGFVVGATVLVSLFIFMFVSVLVDLPWVGDSFKWVNDNVKLEEIQNLGASLHRIVQAQEEQVELLKELTNNQ